MTYTGEQVTWQVTFDLAITLGGRIPTLAEG